MSFDHGREYLDFRGGRFSKSGGGMRFHQAQTHDHCGAVSACAKITLLAGQMLREPALLFKALDESVIE